ncbi:potential fungal zinc cluster transcription factor [Pseudozyma hubeiensis SY62]|uniref:Potential fungal zinc cluster transcription factor n=1 Tax=Pseudozyma hubeiensis (strain SY62) TaxID=1305764 RepID=R9NY65_PSEHS|nr:potential fungal zinc cluster transcription factor [Pseudozyma hubeiensis SY62]GAC93619.1 potential fungal zinc cluster transcription factor [Pseudozyma hubeiensis SY62]
MQAAVRSIRIVRVSLQAISASTSDSSLGTRNGSVGAPDRQQQRSPVAAQAVKRRRYARRSCLTCRSKKTRCELPDEAVASSHDPLPAYKACHRCRALDIPCVVWDGDRKRKPRFDSINSSSNPSRNYLPSLSQRAAPAPVHSRGVYAAHPAYAVDTVPPDTTTSHSSQHTAFQHDVDEKSHLAHDWRSASTSSDSPRRNDLYERPRYPPEAGSRNRPPYSAQSAPKTAAASAVEPSPRRIGTRIDNATTTSTTADGHYDAALYLDPRSSDGVQTKVLGSEIHILNSRFMHSPLVTLNRFITKIPSFSLLLRPEMDRSFDGPLSSLLTHENMRELNSHLPRLRMWHPHISDLESLRTAFHDRPKPSTSLLLATVCLVAAKIAGNRQLAKNFAVHVDRVGLQVLISSPKEFHAAQAFELLLAHGPSLIGASVDPSGAESNNSAVFGESLHSSATATAEAIGLDLVMSQALQDGLGAANQDHSPELMDKIRGLLSRFSLWCSLSIWRAKFVLLNSFVRPCDFSRLRRDAEFAISLVDKLAQRDHNQTKPSKDEILFRAGVLALAYRAIQVADFHVRLSQLDTLWNSRPLFTDAEVRREITSRVDQHLEFLADFKRTKRHRLWTMANLAELKFLDRWVDLEFQSDWVFLFQLYMRMGLPVNQGIATVLELSDSIGRDANLYHFLFGTGQRSYLDDEAVLAGFAGALRFEGETLEQTGLPLLLTCGYILHICICIMEGVSFVQYSLHDTAMREDVFALVLSRLAERLCSSMHPEVESLEKLVSSMLVQMARRLEELEYYKITRNPLMPNTSSMTSSRNSGAGVPSDARRPKDPSSGPISNPTRQEHQAHLSQSGPAHEAAEPSGASQTAPDSGQVRSLRQGTALLMNALPSQIAADVPITLSGGNDADNVAAASFGTNRDALLPTSDTWSSDNMARIMDQILSWDIMPDMAFANNGNPAC